MNITKLKQGSLSGLRKQTNECLDAAYNKGFEDGKKHAINELPELANKENEIYNDGYDNALEDFEKLFIHEHDYEEFFEDTYGSKDPDYNLYDLVAKYGAKKVLNDFKKWQKKKHEEEIKVGDEVVVTSVGFKGIVLSIYSNERYRVIYKDGIISNEGKNTLKRTGRHFDELQQLLDKMKE